MIKEFIRLKKFWKNKRVFITGHTGFKGSWTIIFLNILGAKIAGYSSQTKNKDSLYKKAKLKKFLEVSSFGDIKDYKKLKNNILKFKPDFIIHFAAQSIVDNSYLNPKKTFDTNINGAINILDILKEINFVKVAIISTSYKIYDNQFFNTINKTNLKFSNFEPYSISKICVDLICKSYNKSFFQKNSISLNTVRTSNLVGGGDYSDRLIPKYINYLSANKKIKITDNGVRSWMHVIEAIYGYLLLLEKQYRKNIFFIDNSWNFVPKKNSHSSVLNVIKLLNNFFNKKINTIANYSIIKKKYNSLNINSIKTKKFTSWKSLLSLTDTFELVSSWHKDTIKGNNILEVSRNQIFSYLNKVNKSK
jgi:CDP-glucose 4,6-dehydratase